MEIYARIRATAKGEEITYSHAEWAKLMEAMTTNGFTPKIDFMGRIHSLPPYGTP